MPKEINSLEELNDAIAFIKSWFKDTVELFYDDIRIKTFIRYSYNSERGIYEGRFLGEDNHPYGIEIDREGLPTVQKFDLILWLKDSINRASASLTVKEITEQEFKDEKFQGKFVGSDDANYDFKITPFLAKTQIRKLDT